MFCSQSICIAFRRGLKKTHYIIFTPNTTAINTKQTQHIKTVLSLVKDRMQTRSLLGIYLRKLGYASLSYRDI